jgi:hypothetical protein
MRGEFAIRPTAGTAIVHRRGASAVADASGGRIRRILVVDDNREPDELLARKRPDSRTTGSSRWIR